MANLVVIQGQELDNKLEEVFFRCFKAVVKHHLPKESTQSTTHQPDPDRYLSKKEAAKYAGVGTSTIDNWIRFKYIKKYKFGGSVRIRFEELKAYLLTKAA